jgi:hypothetical protein
MKFWMTRREEEHVHHAPLAEEGKPRLQHLREEEERRVQATPVEHPPARQKARREEDPTLRRPRPRPQDQERKAVRQSHRIMKVVLLPKRAPNLNPREEVGE